MKKRVTNKLSNEKIAIMVDSKTFQSKPKGEMAGGIKKRLTSCKLTVVEIANQIKTGHTVCPGVLQNGMKAENWINQQIFMIDIDNNLDKPYLTSQKALQICRDNNILPAIKYYSFSHTENKPKFRLCFIMDKAVEDEGKRKIVIETLISLFPQSDHSCKNADRLFYGTNKEVCILDKNARICQENILHAFTLPNISTNQMRQFRSDKQLSALIGSFDFLNYLENRNGKITSSNGSITHFKDCEICGHHDNLVYFKNTNTFCCYSPKGGKGGSIIDYIIATKNMTANQAIDYFKYELCGYERLDEWLPPVPFDEIIIPPFPIDCLPPVLKDFVLAVAETTQTPVDMAGVAILAVVSTCVQGKFKIEGKPDWIEPLNIYCIIVANSAERKSPVMKHLTECLYEYEKQKNTIMKRQKKLGKIDDFKFLRILADNASVEALTTLLANNNGKMSLISSEGGIFDILNGQYSHKVNIDTLLKGHDGEHIYVDRMNRPTEEILDISREKGGRYEETLEWLSSNGTIV